MIFTLENHTAQHSLAHMVARFPDAGGGSGNFSEHHTSRPTYHVCKTEHSKWVKYVYISSPIFITKSIEMSLISLRLYTILHIRNKSDINELTVDSE